MQRVDGGGVGSGGAGEEFRHAISELRKIITRPEIDVTETPAPQRLAPYAVALTAEVLDGDEELANGRLVLLHDPDGQDSWDGRWRVVVFCKAAVEEELAADPVLSDVGWTWLEEALSEIRHVALGGTVTRTHSHSYGELEGREIRGDLELRASWTPVDPEQAADSATPHVNAWLDLLARMAGLEPLPPGVARIGQR